MPSAASGQVPPEPAGAKPARKPRAKAKGAAKAKAKVEPKEPRAKAEPKKRKSKFQDSNFAVSLNPSALFLFD